MTASRTIRRRWMFPKRLPGAFWKGKRTSSHESSSTNAGNLGRYGTPYCTLTVQYHGHTPSYAESVSQAIAAEF